MEPLGNSPAAGRNHRLGTSSRITALGLYALVASHADDVVRLAGIHGERLGDFSDGLVQPVLRGRPPAARSDGPHDGQQKQARSSSTHINTSFNT
ncbi:hypothetical protein D187_008483 [Cystobacter fuscus DSM 2262]|uniref:Uncharacterized protein n=1 Tax=Cystobacter fuscus (strain ATCC 25194 / DSM 2262 / NBRC 100088 / M29) TaxID=1242864 RepID=S9PGT4_CYSF2|nr:hypothetical protein D187_008483 [Cystobacter fuscus DSM 2262]